MVVVCLIALFTPRHMIAAEQGSGERPTIGLVLSGGGARGAAHAGVIKILDDMQIPVDYIAGTSMGAIVGGLYASGMSADELVNLFGNVDWSDLMTDRPPRGQRSFRRKSDDSGFLVDFDLGVDKQGILFPEGIIQGQNLEIALKRLTASVITVHDFDRLPIPFRAIATDIVTGEAVILKSGDLAEAMRASMSVPGLFKPVRRDGRVLVDGGVANNLPVQIVQDMGADILIVVDAGFPLLAEEQLTSALALTKQMLTILIKGKAQDQIALLSSNDILISPDLGDLASQDFHRLAEAMQIGVAATDNSSIRLAALSVSDSEYFAFRQQIKSSQHDAPVIDRVVVKNQSRLSPRVLAARLGSQEGKPLDIDRLEEDLTSIYGFNTFETVTYDVSEDSGTNTLQIRATEKNWGPNYVRFGMNLEDDFDGNSNYNLGARLTRTEINPLGGELRFEIQVGETPRLFAEWFQPLDYASKWFINPQIELARSSSGIFDETGLQLAELGSESARVSLDVGRQFGNWGSLSVGHSRSRSEGNFRIGLPQPLGGTTKLADVTVGFEIDTIDNLAVPRSGTSLSVDWIGVREGLGADVTVDATTVQLLKPISWGKNTILNWWTFGSTTKGASIGLRPFSLGGLFSLTGYGPQELSGQHVGIGRMLYYRRLGEQTLPFFKTPIYLGASVEVGNVWQDTDAISTNNVLTAGSVFVVIDSLFGPLYLAYGAAEGGRKSAYLFLGQTF